MQLEKTNSQLLPQFKTILPLAALPYLVSKLFCPHPFLPQLKTVSPPPPPPRKKKTTPAYLGSKLFWPPTFPPYPRFKTYYFAPTPSLPRFKTIITILRTPRPPSYLGSTLFYSPPPFFPCNNHAKMKQLSSRCYILHNAPLDVKTQWLLWSFVEPLLRA